MIKLGLFFAFISSALARSTKYRPDGTCGVQNVLEECPGTICIRRLHDQDNCMTCECDYSENRMDDMVLSTEEISFIIDGNRKGKAKGADPSRPLWNNIKEGSKFVIPYALSSDLTAPFIDAINAAIAEVQTKCCFTFRKRTTESDYMFFFKGSGCFANVGRLPGENRISIGQGCEYKGITVHEIMHNLGFFHEHQRPDRDTYVKVVMGNISPNSQDQYQIIQSIDSQGSPYDYGSIMHYGAYAFAVDSSKPTMTFANGSDLAGIQESAMSIYDAQQIATLYNCQAPTENTTASVTTTAAGTTTAAVTTTVTSVATTVAATTTNSTSSAVATITPNTNVTTTSAAVGLTTTVAGTTTNAATTTSATVTVANPDCVDSNSECSTWEGLGFCTNPKYSAIPKLCPKSCKICTAASPCFDKFGPRICSAWEEFCPFNVHVKAECKKTCGLC